LFRFINSYLRRTNFAVLASDFGGPLPFQQTSLEHLAESLDDSGDLIIFVKRESSGRLVVADCNVAAERALGKSRAAMLGKFGFEDLIEDGQDDSLARLDQAVLARQSRNGDLRLRAAAGGGFWFGYHVMPCPSDEGLSMILGRDITARRAEREQANAVQALLAKVFMMVETGVSIIGPDGRFLMTNPFHDRMLGYPPGSLNGRQSRELIAPESQEAGQKLLQSAFVRSDNLTNDLWLLRADGSAISVRLTSTLVEGADRRKLRVVTATPLPVPPRPPAELRLQSAGKIRFISVDEVRLRLANRWSALEQKVMDLSEQIISRRLGVLDTFSRTHDQGFVVCFHSLSEDEATIEAAAIGREIRTKLIGMEEENGPIEVVAVVTTVPVVPGVNPRPMLESRLGEVERRALQSATDPVSPARPILSTKTGDRVGCYLDPSNRLPGGGRIALAPAQFDRDMKLLRIAAAHALRNQNDPQRFPVLFPIDFEMFQSHAKTVPFLAACRSLDPVSYQNMMPILIGLPRGIPSAKIVDVVQRLKPFCWAVGFNIESQDQQIPELSAGPTPILVVDGTAWARTADLPARFLGRLVSAVKPPKGQVLVRNAAAGEIARELAALGVELFTESDKLR